jgi:hypothetical protein
MSVSVAVPTGACVPKSVPPKRRHAPHCAPIDGQILEGRSLKNLAACVSLASY